MRFISLFLISVLFFNTLSISAFGVTTCEISVKNKYAANWNQKLWRAFDLRWLSAKVPSRANWKSVEDLIAAHPLGDPTTGAWLQDIAARSIKNQVSYEEVLAYGAVVDPQSFGVMMAEAKARNLNWARQSIGLAWKKSNKVLVDRGLLDLGGILKVIRFPARTSDYQELMTNLFKALAPPKPSLGSVALKTDWKKFNYTRVWIDENEIWKQNQKDAMTFFLNLQKFSTEPRSAAEVEKFLSASGFDKDLKELQRSGIFSQSSPSQTIAYIYGKYDRVKANGLVYQLAKAVLFRVPFLFMLSDFMRSPENYHPTEISHWLAIAAALFPERLFLSVFQVEIAGYAASQTGFTDKISNFTNEGYKFVERAFTDALCYRKDGVSCDQVDSLKTPSMKSMTIQSQIDLITPEQLESAGGYDLTGLMNDSAKNDPIGFPCDPYQIIYKNYQKNLAVEMKEAATTSAKNQMNSLNTRSTADTAEVCRVKLRRSYYNLHRNEFKSESDAIKEQMEK